MYKDFFETAKAEGQQVHEWAVVKTTDLIFSAQLHDYCKANACGMYNKSWTCPPLCDSVEEQEKLILSFENALVFTTMYELEDSFDIEGMDRGMEIHNRLTLEIREKLGGLLTFSAGSCSICSTCACPAPCLFPESRIGSLEAAGINVTELSKAAGIAYNNGENTATFFSMVLLK